MRKYYFPIGCDFVLPFSFKFQGILTPTWALLFTKLDREIRDSILLLSGSIELYELKVINFIHPELYHITCTPFFLFNMLSFSLACALCLGHSSIQAVKSSSLIRASLASARLALLLLFCGYIKTQTSRWHVLLFYIVWVYECLNRITSCVEWISSQLHIMEIWYLLANTQTGCPNSYYLCSSFVQIIHI